MTQADLIAYSKNGSDPQGRMAAKIAADNYGDLQTMANSAIGKVSSPQEGISAKDLQADINLMNGNEKDALSTIRKKDVLRMAGEEFASAAGLIGGSAAFLECPPVGVLLGAGGVVALGASVNTAKDFLQAPGKLKAETVKDQQMVNSWLYVDMPSKDQPAVQQQPADKVSNT
jgi:hypothetical protein